MAEFFIPTKRVQPFVKKLIEERDYIPKEAELVGGLSVLEIDSGLNERILGNISRLRQASVSFETLDRLLVRTGNWHLWFVPPEEGGFSDYYVDESPYVRPRVATRRGPRYCEKCEKRLHSQAKGNHCAKCYREANVAKLACADCGAKVSWGSARCRPCAFAHRAKSRAPKEAKEWMSGTGRIINKWAHMEKKDKRWNHS